MSALQNPSKGSSDKGQKNRKGIRGRREQAPDVDVAGHDSPETAYQGAAQDEWAESSAAPEPNRRAGWIPDREKGSGLQEEIGDINPADDDDEEDGDDDDDDDDDDEDEEDEEGDGDDDVEDEDEIEHKDKDEDSDDDDLQTSARGRNDKPLRAAAKLDGGRSKSSRNQQGRSTTMAKKGSTQTKSASSKKGGSRKKEETQQSTKAK